jgi:hypothetical protein
MAMRSPAGFISAFFDPLKNPNAPTSPVATGGDVSASVAFTAPANVGGSAITEYYAVANDGTTGNAASSPVTVSGLTNGTPYTFQVWALNSYGPGVFSVASNSVTPATPPPNGFFAGGITGVTAFTEISQTVIASSGTFSTFGQLTVGRYSPFGVGSTTRGIIAGGADSSNNGLSSMDYITYATTGNATNFGNMTTALYIGASMTNTTRGVFGGGWNGGTPSTVMGYVTIASVGNATSFGTLARKQRNFTAVSNQTYGVMMGGYNPDDGTNDFCQYITIATTGNSTQWSSMNAATTTFAGLSSATRGIFTGSSFASVIQFITISTSGSNTAFGDLPFSNSFTAGCSNSVTGLIGGGTDPVQKLTIATTGSQGTFGNLGANARGYMVGLSSLGGGS